MKIMVVEDELLIGMATESMLTNAGHEVVGPFRTEQSALQSATHSHPDVALIDINLAGGVEGLALAKALLDRHGIPCMFTTGQPTIAWANKGAAFGVLAKPYSEASLLSTVGVIEKILGGGKPPPPSIPDGLSLF